MYLNKLKSWDDKRWALFFEWFPYLSEEEKMEVKQILTLESKEWIDACKDRLFELWIVNWIWPYWLPRIVRSWITWVFPYMDWFWHDIGYLLADTPWDRLDSDLWFLKYSKISVSAQLALVFTECKTSIDMFYFWYICTTYYPKIITAYIFFILLRIFWFKSVKYTKPIWYNL